MNHTFLYKTDIGMIGITENGSAITELFFCEGKEGDSSLVLETNLLNQAVSPVAETPLADQDLTQMIATSLSKQVTHQMIETTLSKQVTTQMTETPLLKEAGFQLSEYFAGSRTTFNLPLAPKGTEFQQAVWKTLQVIPYGETWSYKKVAETIGNPKASRAVGMANNKNPIAIFIPCHRVIGANGKLVGYAGGLGIKTHLLELENKHGKVTTWKN